MFQPLPDLGRHPPGPGVPVPTLGAGESNDLLPPPQPAAAPALDLTALAAWPEGPPRSAGPLPVVPGYEVLGLLGEGGMGIVYKARQVGLNRTVALKMIRPDHHADEQVRARFRREAEAVAALKHPHIVTVHAVGEHDGRPYLAFEFVPGGSLADGPRGQPRPARVAAALVADVAGAVQHAHQRGILHRDLKPSNVLLDERGRPLLTDFGLARPLQPDAGLTGSGAPLGSPAYMAPEQAGGRPEAVGPATDVFGLGAILYELLTGRPPHQGADLLSTLEQAARGAILPARRVNPKVPRALNAICARALAPEPGQRYASAAEMERDLRRYLGRPRRLALAGVGALVLMLAVALLPLLRRKPAVAPEQAPLSGELVVRIWSMDKLGKRGLKVEEAGALPARNGEAFHVEARLSRPAHVYLVWLRGGGGIEPLYPWTGDELTGSPPEASPEPVVHSPPELDRGWKMDGPSGLETVLLLARATPLRGEVPLADVLAKVGPAPLRDHWEVAVRGWDRDRALEPIDLFRPRGKQTQQIDDPLLRLMERLRGHFEVIRAVRFAHLE